MVLITQGIQHRFQLCGAFFHYPAADGPVLGVAKHPEHLPREVACPSNVKPGGLIDWVCAYLHAHLHRVNIVQAVDAVSGPVDIGVSVPGEQVVPHERTFPLKSIQ